MDGRDPRYETEYYRPYDSADDSGSDSESSTVDSWYYEGMDQEPPPQGVNREGIPNFRAFATQIQLRDAAGRTFSTIRDQVSYGTNKLGKYTTYSQYDAPPPDLSGEDTYGRTRFATADGSLTSLVLIDSRYRDRQAYPQPTFFTLRLPRIYKQVTNITLSDLKLLTSFYFFRTSKGNTDITVYEKGRTTYNPYTNTTTSTIVKRFITTGSYNIESLLQEVQLQLNYTPLFFDFVGGYSDFYNLFSATGDYALNFNEPGDYFFDNTTNLWISKPTINTIVGQFWKSRYAGLVTYTPNQILLAYYYPVLNEFLFDEDYTTTILNLTPGINVLPGLTTVEDVRNHILYDFSGIAPSPDPVVLAVVQANIASLDEYRIRHTFRYWLINKYVVGRDTRSQNVYITSPSLNTSLVNLLTKKAEFYLLEAIQLNGLSGLNAYNQLIDSVSKALVVAQAMYDFEQQRFLTYFAVPWSQYTLGYYANLSNTFFLQNGVGATGVPSNPAESQDAGIVPYSTNTLLLERNEPPAYWPNMVNLTTNTVGASTISMVNLSTATSSFNLVYDMYNSNFNPRQPIVEAPNDYLYSEYLTKSANVVCPIQPSKYTVFKFRSPVRQTLQIETLPRPTIYRLPQYNLANFGSTINQYYDLSYAYVTSVPYDQYDPQYTYIYDNILSTNLFQVPGWASSNAPTSFGTSYQTSINNYQSSLTLDVTTRYRALFATFTTPDFPGASANSNYTYSLNVSAQFYSNASTIASAPPNQCRMFLYHDRAGFQADALSNRYENPLFYKASTVITTTDISGTISFITYPNQQYYVSVRADDFNYGQTFVRITPYFNTTTQSTVQTKSIAGINPETDILSPTFSNLVQSNWNYAQVYDSNWIRLPISPSTLWGASDPSGDPENDTLAIYNVPIGYDSNSVSTDYTDYIPYWSNSVDYGFTPNSNLGIDPINQYIFQSNSPYNSTSQVFLYADGTNSVLTPGLRLTYFPTLVNERQYKICQYYSPNYIAFPDSNFSLSSNLISSESNFQLPYTISTTMNTAIGGYTYGGGAVSTLQLGRGVLGFNFIPEEGVWDIKRVMFRSAINDSNNDPNKEIKYLGVYNMIGILSTPTAQLSMCNAIAVLSNTARRTYTNPGTVNDGSFDTKGGTYYEFQKDPFFVPQQDIPILGYSQSIRAMSDQPESMYTLIAFNQYGIATPITALSGAAVPYPFYNNAFPSTTYLDGTRAYNSNQQVVFPSTIGPVAWPLVSSLSTVFGPPAGVDVTQSQFALSMPIGTSVLNYKLPVEPASDTGFVYPWSTIMTPNKVIANVSTFVLLQDTNFNIYRYDENVAPRTFTNPVWSLTADEIYPTYEVTSLVSITANSSYFYFLGLSNDNNINYQVRLKRYNPFTGVLFDYNVDNSFNLPLGGTVKGFVVNDFEQVVVAYDTMAATTNLYYTMQPSSIMNTKTLNGTSTVTLSMDVTTSTLYYIPLNRTTNEGINAYEWSVLDTAGYPGTAWTPTGSGIPSTWTGIAVNAASNVPAAHDRVTLISQTAGYASNLYYVSNWTTGPNQWQVAKIATPITNAAGVGQAIGTLTNGYRGALWITAGEQPYVWGTRNTTADINGLVDSAWQIFYPFQKIVLEKTANTFNAIVDKTYIDYPEWPHTAMFYYRNGTTFSNDINRKWGLEKSSNFYVSDTNMNGYYFNSYIFNVPLVKSVTSNDYQYITVRGYTPTESSETLLRFVLPNEYDFGYATQFDLIDEIALYQDSNTHTQFNSNYGVVISNFDIAFQQSNSYFGAGYLPNFLGSNLNSSNYASFASNFSNLYASYQSNAAILSNITTYVTCNIQQYISSQLTYIIPSYAIGRTNYLDPILFSLLWKSGLLPQYRDLLEDWGLGYNLGYSKIDTPFSTYARAASFYKILEDYIFLRLNPQYQLNRMDNTFKENFKVTRDSTGQIKNFHGKLLLNNFNTYSQTFIYNNQPFNPPIGRLDHFYFQWVNVVGDTIDNNDCDWSATAVITENTAMATTASTIPALPPMQPLRK